MHFPEYHPNGDDQPPVYKRDLDMPRLKPRAAFGGVLSCVIAMLALALAFPAGLVSAQDDSARADATVRVIHASPDAPAVDVLLDGQPLLENVKADSASDYQAITPETHRIQIVPQGQTADSALVDEEIDAAPGAAYIVAVYGRLNDLQGAIIDVDLSEIEPGNARVHLINFSPDAGAVNIGIEGDDANLFEGVDFGKATDYVILDAGDYPIEVRPGDDDMTVALRSDVTLEEGTVYDLVAIGRAEDRSLSLLVLTAPVAIQTGEMATPEAVTGDESLAATVEPETLTDGTSTPTS